MANILRLTSTDSILANSNVEIRKSFFGMVTTGVYLPTEGKIKARIIDLDTETGYKVKRLIEASDDRIQQAVDSVGKVQEAAIGNMQLELCTSADGQFAALRLLKFEGLDYRPVTDVRICEGAAAQLVSSIF